MRKLMLMMLVLALAACGQPDTGAQPGAANPTPPAQMTPELAPPTPAPQARQPTEAPPAEAPPATTVAAPADALILQSRTALARHLGLKPEQLRFSTSEWKEWPDGALGCPAPGMAYPEVLMSGFLLTFNDGQRSYAVHTNETGASMVLCDNQQPIDLVGASAPLPTSANPDAPVSAPADLAGQMAEAARATLARELGVDPSAVTVVSVEPTQWRDSSLGCPQPDAMYLQVITPGYRVIAEAQGRRYELHTDERGTVVRCDQ